MIALGIICWLACVIFGILAMAYDDGISSALCIVMFMAGLTAIFIF